MLRFRRTGLTPAPHPLKRRKDDRGISVFLFFSYLCSFLLFSFCSLVLFTCLSEFFVTLFMQTIGGDKSFPVQTHSSPWKSIFPLPEQTAVCAVPAETSQRPESPPCPPSAWTHSRSSELKASGLWRWCPPSAPFLICRELSWPSRATAAACRSSRGGAGERPANRTPNRTQAGAENSQYSPHYSL